MRKKLKNEAGLTVIEMLAATIVLVLLALMLNTGLQMAFNTYETMIAKSEVELLLSTAVDTLADELRYARDAYGADGSGFNYYIDDDGNGISRKLDGGFTYTSSSFGAVTDLKVDATESSNNKGQIMVTVQNGASPKDLLVLSTGAYGNQGISYKAYEVTAMTVTLHKDSDGKTTFTIVLKMQTTDSRKISAETTVTVRCLNRAKGTTT